MKRKKSRYDTSDMIDAQIEPGSGGRVLKAAYGVRLRGRMGSGLKIEL
jgi:hypothetical protein